MRANFFGNIYLVASGLILLLGVSFLWPPSTPFFTLLAVVVTGLITKKISGLHGRPHLWQRLTLSLTLVLSSFLLILSLEHLAVRLIALLIIGFIYFRLLQRLREEGTLPLPERARDTTTPTLAFLLTTLAAGAGTRSLVTFLSLPVPIAVVLFLVLTSLAARGSLHLQLPGGVIPLASFVVFILLMSEIATLVAFFPWSPLSSGTILATLIGYIFLILTDALAERLDRRRVFLYSSASMVTLVAVLATARWLA